MPVESALSNRSGAKCELCSAADGLAGYSVEPNSGAGADTMALICATCRERIGNPASLDPKQWYCLSESMWSEHNAVKVLAYRLLKAMAADPWAQDLLSQIYLDDETQAWADAGLFSVGDAHDDGDTKPTVDSNGTTLQEGDTVTLIKDLEVKGANFTAKRGTTVKGINLTDDPKYVEGRVNGIRIVLVAAYLKKA